MGKVEGEENQVKKEGERKQVEEGKNKKGKKQEKMRWKRARFDHMYEYIMLEPIFVSNTFINVF